MTGTTAISLADALELGINARMQPVLADLASQFLASHGAALENETSPAAQAATLAGWTRRQLERIAELHHMAQAFNGELVNVADDTELHAIILGFAEQMGADARQLRRDRKAFARYFDTDAVLERYRRRVGERERALVYGLDRTCLLAARSLAGGESDGAARLIAQTVPELLREVRAYRGDKRVRLAAYRGLRVIAEAAPVRLEGFWIDLALRDMRRVALDGEDDAWSQCEALSALLALSPESFVSVIERRLGEPPGAGSPQRLDNRLFVRRHLARLMCKAIDTQPRLARFLGRLGNDPDGAVRQALAQALPDLPVHLLGPLFASLGEDADPQVRAGLLADPVAMARATGTRRYLEHLMHVLTGELDEFVLRLGMAAAVDFAAWQLDTDDGNPAQNIMRLRAALTRVRSSSDNLKVRRWAGEARERLWLLSDAEARELAEELRAAIRDQREGRSRRMPQIRAMVSDDPDRAGRVLAVLAIEDFGLDLEGGRRPRLWRGDRFGVRLWRVFHEVRISASDKRQAFRHMIGRRYAGRIIAPSARLAELAPTKVPGEPLHQSREAGWRNYLPLPDHVLAAIDHGGETRLFTAEGITTIHAPRGLWRRLAAFFKLSWRFGQVAAQRNYDNNDYARTLERLGVGLEYAPHPEKGDVRIFGKPDPQVERFFSFGSALPVLSSFWERASAYFATVYQNSLLQLAVFLALAGGWFLGRHAWRYQRMVTFRRSVPLVLGGWGTRGKSGTERLKAGLINALGEALVSKTTGCEAMFLHGTAFGELREMFLFRPYDKATIWEQWDLMRTTRGLGAKVFLWECMGLTPSYVRVLQQHWMRDDISTITNTYPDHEDVQGPAGRNIPEVMTEFIPRRSVLLTTEEEMLPILEEGAAIAGTRLRPVNWKQAGLIHENLLKRFPYAEHPNNIALVTAMADELGLEEDFAIKEMSDRVVADLGVLKVYPRSQINGRTLEFVMGMSANERFGAMGNWTRMGFEDHDLGRDPEIFITTVVNNRADRVPRSRVFARMLVEDIFADRHVLIGSNLKGLAGFIEESWTEFAATLTLFGEEGEPLKELARLARRQRVPRDPGELSGRLRAMLAPQSEKIAPETAETAAASGNLLAALHEAGVEGAEDIAAHHDMLRDQLAEYQQLHASVSAGGNPTQLDEAVRQFLHKCFIGKLVPVNDYYTPGEDIVRLIARLTPPGLVNRILGMQNIKGTGLDFVYRWQAWDAVYKACVQTQDNDASEAMRGIQTLAAFKEYGALSEVMVRETVARLKQRSTQNSDMFNSQLDLTLARLDAQLAELRQNSDESGADSGAGPGTGEPSGESRLGKFASKATEVIEAYLDSTDAVVRRRTADRIYRAMIAEQISSGRAAVELKKLTSRQKGGWLGPDISAMATTVSGFFARRSEAR